MKTVWHIIRKDIARDRWALLMWAALFVAQVLLGVVARQNDGTDLQWVTYLQLANAGLVWLQVGMGYILTARLVQADALVGTTMFWPTRPISAVRLLAAKAIGVLLLFGLLPVLLLLPWWLYCAFEWRGILWTAVDTLGWQLLVIAPAFLVASLTDDLGRVLLWTLLLVVGVFSGMVLLQASLSVSVGNLGARAGAGGILFTRLWVAGVVLVTSAAVIAAHQYMSRRFTRSVVLVVFSLGLIAVVGQAWPWNWAAAIGAWHRPALPATIAGLDGFTITTEYAPGGDVTGRAAKDQREQDSSLSVLARARGLPDGMSIAAEKAVLTWSWTSGLNLTRVCVLWGDDRPRELRRMLSLPMPQADPETDQWIKARHEKTNAEWRAKGLPPIRPLLPVPGLPPIEDGLFISGHVRLPNSFLEKMRSESPACRAVLQCLLLRPRIVFNLPLEAKSHGSSWSKTVRLRRLTDDEVVIVTTKPSVVEAGLWHSAFAGAEFRSWFFKEQFLTVNHVTGDISGMNPAEPGSRSAVIGGVVVGWDPRKMRPRYVIRGGQWVPIDPQWREHTTLVLMAEQEIARFRREVTAEKFELAAKSTE